jgi:hypothetical protein
MEWRMRINDKESNPKDITGLTAAPAIDDTPWRDR